MAGGDATGLLCLLGEMGGEDTEDAEAGEDGDMTLKLSPKQARKMGLIEKTPPAPKPRAIPGPNSYAGCGLIGWMFTTIGEKGESVYAWKVQKGEILRTLVYPAGAGGNLGAHYRPAIDAIVRGEYGGDASQVERL